MTKNSGFPICLLEQPIENRAKYFHEFTVAHPLLVKSTKQVLDTIKNPEGYSIFMVIGPTGVGKTTLRKKVEKIVIQEMLSEMENDKSFIPIVGMEIVSPDSGKFSWIDYYKRALQELNEPMIDKKIDYDQLFLKSNFKSKYALTSKKTTAMELRKSLESAFHYRRTVTFLIDEAQHFTKMASGRRYQDQLDTIKSLSNMTNVIHVLIGTYELLPFVNLSGQLSRRTIDIHFPRYKADSNDDLYIFNSVLKTFESHMPLEKESNLIKYWDFIYERTIGCVGILKNWLERCLNEALHEGYKSIDFELLKKHSLSLSKAEKMAIEAIEGESTLEDNEEKKINLHKILGINSSNGEKTTNIDKCGKSVGKNKKKHNVGQRKPMRDEVGQLEKAK